MTDRELLEAAAKAAGMLTDGWHRDGGIATWMPGQAEELWSCWNPLEDDGDAQRLAVKLNIHITSSAFDAWASTPGTDAIEPMGADPYAATRRAIVRAAAALAGAAQEAQS